MKMLYTIQCRRLVRVCSLSPFISRDFPDDINYLLQTFSGSLLLLSHWTSFLLHMYIGEVSFSVTFLEEISLPQMAHDSSNDIFCDINSLKIAWQNNCGLLNFSSASTLKVLQYRPKLVKMSECQTAWIQVTRRLVWIQAVCIWHLGRAWWAKG